MCMILKNVSLALVEMNRQDVFTRLFYFFSSSLMLFGITESLWSSFAGGRQYGVWAGERHSSCSCLSWWCSSPLPRVLLANTLLTVPKTLFQRGLTDACNFFATVLHYLWLTPRQDRGQEVPWEGCWLREELTDTCHPGGPARACSSIRPWGCICADESGPAAW